MLRTIHLPNSKLSYLLSSPPLFILVTYILLGEIILYFKIQTSSGILPISSPTNLNSSSQLDNIFGSLSPWKCLNIKSLLLDPVNFYIFHPLSSFLIEIFPIFEKINPNWVSISHPLIALIGAFFIADENLGKRRFGVMLFVLRSFLDALDGAIARRRRIFLHIENPYGYYIDGLCDAAGFILLFASCCLYLHRLKKSKSKKYITYVPLAEKHKTKNEDILKSNEISPILAVWFGLNCLLSSVLWNRSINSLQELLENENTIVKNSAQIVKSNLFFSLVLTWRVVNPESTFHALLIFIFFDKMEQMLRVVKYTIYLVTVGAGIFSEIYIYHIGSR